MEYSEVFTELKNSRSRLRKLHVLKQADDLTREIFEYAYNPFKHYYINKIAEHKSASTIDLFQGTRWKEMLTDLHTRELSGDAAKLFTQDLLEEASPEDAALFVRILRKDLRCGVSAKTINAAIPGLIPEFGAMLAKKWDAARYNPGSYMSIKYDGLRAVFKEGNLFTRNGHKIQGVQHLTEAIPADYSFDGELLIPGLHFQKSSGLIRSDNPIPEAVYYVFDIPESTLPFNQRYKLYSDVCSILDKSFIKSVKHVVARNKEHIANTFKKSLTAGYEGLVLKSPYHLYQAKRSWDWMKLKAEKSEDLKVSGFFEGEGKYKGQLGGLIVDYHDTAVRVGSGFSDAERVSIWENQIAYLGEIVEVKYHEVTPDGSLRHPVYNGVRWDKD